MARIETLEERVVIRALETLRNRVAERFPARGLTQTAAELVDIARVSARQAASLEKPIWSLRLFSAITMCFGVYFFWMLANFLQTRVDTSQNFQLTELTQGLDATFNILLICGLVIAFFWRLEGRYKRNKALSGLYQLRALCHVIDMHQLTKDPVVIVGLKPTASSPVRDLTTAELLRYLDYCTEMLSLIGKLAALYVQYFPDARVTSAVNDVEELTTDLSRKIWQKIILVQQTGQ